MIKKKIDPKYKSMIEQIKIDAEDYADEEMKPVYAEQKKSLDALHVMLGTLFIKYAIDGLLSMNTSQKASVTSQFDYKFKSTGRDLGNIEVEKMTSILSKVYEDTYYKTAFVMDSLMKVDLKMDLLKKEFISSSVNKVYKSEMFSDRIWNNKSLLIDKLSSSLTDAMKGNTHLDAIVKYFQKTFNVQAYVSKRLVDNEGARLQSQASDDIAHNTGVTKQLYSATLDGKTSDVCAADDGKIWDIDDPDKVIPPENHVSCRCVLINLLDDYVPTKRKDNETKDIIDYVQYDQWLKDKGVEE